MEGLLVLDNSALRYLRNSESRETLKRSCRCAGLTVYVSAINAMEAAAAHEVLASDLAKVLLDLGEGRALLPPPDDLLRRAGEQARTGAPFWETGETGYEWMLANPEKRAARRLEVAKIGAQIEETFAQSQTDAHKEFRRYLQDAGVRDFVNSAREFLDWFWEQKTLPLAVAEATWKSLNETEGFPGARVLDHEVWRLFLDGEAVALYEGSLTSTQPKAVQHKDILQLLYLNAGRRRILATADKPLLRVAHTVLSGRYANARAIHITDLTSSAA